MLVYFNLIKLYSLHDVQLFDFQWYDKQYKFCRKVCYEYGHRQSLLISFNKPQALIDCPNVFFSYYKSSPALHRETYLQS